MSSPLENHLSESNIHNEDSTLWIPSSAQIPQPVDQNVSPPRVLRKRKNATPDIPDDMRTLDKSKSNSPSKARIYNGYKISLSPVQKRPRPAPKPLRLPPVRSKDQSLQLQDPTNIPNLNAAPKIRAPIVVSANGLALPQKDIFDPWNVNSGGHQKGDGRTAMGNREYRVERQAKLKSQFGRRMRGQDEVEKGQKSIFDCWTKPAESITADHSEIPTLVRHESSKENEDMKDAKKSNIFKDVVIYVNGSTLPFVSDHYLKHLIAQHGGSTTISLARRSVTHVILTPKLQATSSEQRNFVSAGGGLSARKFEKEIKTMRGPSRNIRFVSPKWIIESIKAGRRLPESRFADWKMADEKQVSVLDHFLVQGKPGVSIAEEKNQ